MKRLLVLTIAVFSLCSCKKWLSVTPKSEISSTELFKSEQGYKDALIGAYLLMTSTSSYGFESTVGFVDVLAQQYAIPGSTHPYYYASLYQYDQLSVITPKDNIWNTNYNAIANLNNIINTIDDKKSSMNPANYALIKGEAMGLRAFLHFDLYRLYGYGNLVNTPAGLSNKTLPYVSSYSKNITPPVTGKAFLDSVKNDLSRAADLMAKYDSISVARSAQNGLDIPNADHFYDNRKMRFNYFAVRATQARVYLWLGEYDKAMAAAQEVITKAQGNLVTFNGGTINDPNPVNKDYTFSTEHIFSLNVQNMYDFIKPYIDQFAADGLNINYSQLAHSGTVANDLYEINTKPGMSLSDYRYKELYKKISPTSYLLLKFTYVLNSSFKDRMPIITLPEMYYIMAECYNETNDPVTAVTYLNTVRTNRGISILYKLPDTLTKSDVTAEIQKEYRKEFVSEGQLFYFYKRRGNINIPGTAKVMDNSIYILPIPQRERDMSSGQ
ncbi:RagB/SusD family nutrient uptake outer membrane protein [Chitinophaga sp. HK235]|uniref:RagB/SusD family nutrient uptake outer membrane protein n=1 Tax=Chitinophaga sp. HK235 TaxID=2952571 RepID=UPI001BA8454B|nr:RagB/SusD family nutrient uptake outer membrane protein [Chitinophaga sp. HK235]